MLGTHTFNFDRGNEVLSTIKNNNIIVVILEGAVKIVNIDYDGNEILLETLKKDDVFGTNISLINSESCNIIATQFTKLLVIDYKIMMKTSNMKYKYFNVFFNNLVDIVMTKYEKTNERIRVLEKKQIRDKLLEYFDIQNNKDSLNYFYLPFSFKELADYLVMDRSAMFRELKNLKMEGFIKVEGRKITILNARNIDLL